MDQPVGLSFLGAFLIVGAAGVICGVLARLSLGTTTLRMALDIGLGILCGFMVIFLLPMRGYTLGNMIGWPAALVLGAALPILVLHLVFGHQTRGRGSPRSR